MLGNHVDEVVAELGEVRGLPVVVPTVDDSRVERALAIVLRQKWSRGQVGSRFANMPPCTSPASAGHRDQAL